MSEGKGPFFGAPAYNDVSRIKRKPSKTTLQRHRDLETALAQIGPVNRALVDDYLLERFAELRVSSRVHVARAFLAMDRHGGGVGLLDLPAKALSEYFKKAAETKSPNTLWGEAAVLRGFFNFRTGHRIPPDLWQALRRKTVPLKWVDPIKQEQFDALLAATDRMGQDFKREAPAHRVKVQAILWTLWDSGFRVGELCALKVGGLEFLGDGRAALTLPESQEGLKTGQRRVPVVECVGALETWMGLHPHADKPWMPLFPSHEQSGNEPYWPQNINQILLRLARTAEMARRITPHLFRHTRATRAALAGWNEGLMRKFFGWSATSDMPAHYVHFVQKDVEDRVRKDAGMDAHGHRKTENVGVGPSDVMLELLKASQENARRQTELMERLAQGLPHGAAPTARPSERAEPEDA